MSERAVTDQLANLIQYSARLVQRGLVIGPGGNTSIRDGERMWISPSGLALDAITDHDWVAVDIVSGKVAPARFRPSSEVEMHLAIYRTRPDVAAIVHTHPTTTIAVISSGFDRIPFLFPDQVALVGELPVIDFVVPCTPALARAVEGAISDSPHAGLLMRNHGLITVGSTVREAYYRTEVVEEAARIFWIGQTLGGARALTPTEVEEVRNLEAERYRQRMLRSPSGVAR